MRLDEHSEEKNRWFGAHHCVPHISVRPPRAVVHYEQSGAGNAIEANLMYTG